MQKESYALVPRRRRLHQQGGPSMADKVRAAPHHGYASRILYLSPECETDAEIRQPDRRACRGWWRSSSPGRSERIKCIGPQPPVNTQSQASMVAFDYLLMEGAFRSLVRRDVKEKSTPDTLARGEHASMVPNGSENTTACQRTRPLPPGSSIHTVTISNANRDLVCRAARKVRFFTTGGCRCPMPGGRRLWEKSR